MIELSLGVSYYVIYGFESMFVACRLVHELNVIDLFFSSFSKLAL